MDTNKAANLKALAELNKRVANIKDQRPNSKYRKQYNHGFMLKLTTIAVRAGIESYRRESNV